MTKNEIISLLITKISNPLPHEYHIETIPPVPNVINKSRSHLTQNNYLPVKTINHTTNVTGNKTESASMDMNVDKNVTVEIIGDSILNGLVDRGLSKNGNIKTRKYPGCTTRDLKHHVIPTIEKKPWVIIIHAGTNDLTNDVKTIANYKYIIEKIKKKSPHTKIAISLLTLRKDRKNIEKMIIP